MTPAQRVAVIMGMLALLALVLTPPWYQRIRPTNPGLISTSYREIGHHSVLLPPRTDYGETVLVDYRIDRERLALEGIAVVVLVGTAYIALGFWRRP